MQTSPGESNIALPVSAVEAVRPGPTSPIEEVVGHFDQSRNQLLRYLSSFALTIPDSEEVIQDTFLALFQHLKQGKSRQNLRGWLFRVAHNLALKKRQRARRDLQGFPESTISWRDWVIDPAPNPEDQFASNQTHKRLRAVVQALPELDRRCLYLRAEGLRYREISEVLDMSLGSVSLSLERSLARIARAAER